MLDHSTYPPLFLYPGGSPLCSHGFVKVLLVTGQINSRPVPGIPFSTPACQIMWWSPSFHWTSKYVCMKYSTKPQKETLEHPSTCTFIALHVTCARPRYQISWASHSFRSTTTTMNLIGIHHGILAMSTTILQTCTYKLTMDKTTAFYTWRSARWAPPNQNPPKKWTFE